MDPVAVLHRLWRMVARNGPDPGGQLRRSATRGDHQPAGLHDCAIAEGQLHRTTSRLGKLDTFHPRGQHSISQLVLGDHIAAELPKEISVGKAIGALQLAAALLTVCKVPQGMGVRMGVMG